MRHIYLQGAVASLSTAFEVDVSRVTRHDVVLRLSIHGEPFQAQAGGFTGQVQAMVVPPLVSHSVRSRGAGFLTYVLHLIHPRFRTARVALGRAPRLLDHAAFAHLVPRMEQACVGQLSVDEACDLMDALLDVLLAGATPAPPIDLRVPWVMRKLDLDIDHPFEQLAAELGVSTSRLSHLFSEQLGLSFRSYQAWARLRQAWEMLAQQPQMSVADVAQALGYADAAHLSRSFHLGIGFPPSVLRDKRFVTLIGHGLPPGQHIPSDEEMSRP